MNEEANKASESAADTSIEEHSQQAVIDTAMKISRMILKSHVQQEKQ